MDAKKYTAAKEGDVNALRSSKILISTQLTPNGNTPLHVVVLFNDSSACIEGILSANESFLHQVNSNGDTALHLAARNGRSNAGPAMVTYAEELDEEVESGGGAVTRLLTARNRNGDTALHEAIRSDCLEMVKIMLQKEPEILKIVNNSLESPLFVAVDRRRSLCVDYILDYCSSLAVAYGGPEGRTALHAAVVHNLEETVKVLVTKYPSIIKEVDDSGWTALHYAARYWCGKATKTLLDADRSIAYIVAESDNKYTALHLATCSGAVQIIQSILSYCPDSWEMVTVDGQNILHLAVEFREGEAMEFILKQSWVGNLINQKDDEGNTPLHLYAIRPHYDDIHHLVTYPLADGNATNKKHMTPLDVVVPGDIFFYKQMLMKRGLLRKGAHMGFWSPINRHMKPYRGEICDLTNKNAVRIDDRQSAGTHMVVATLVMTIAFTAAFTIPGGYNGNDSPNKGLAILSRKAAFKAFIIMDTLAIVCSASAVFIHFYAATVQRRVRFDRLHVAALNLTAYGLGSLVIAFVTGLYAVLQHSLTLAITECAICSIVFLVFCWTFCWKLMRDRNDFGVQEFQLSNQV